MKKKEPIPKKKNIYWSKPSVSRHTFDSKLSREEKLKLVEEMLLKNVWDISSLASYLDVAYNEVNRIHKKLLRRSEKYKEDYENKRLY